MSNHKLPDARPFLRLPSPLIAPLLIGLTNCYFLLPPALMWSSLCCCMFSVVCSSWILAGVCTCGWWPSQGIILKGALWAYRGGCLVLVHSSFSKFRNGMSPDKMDFAIHHVLNIWAEFPDKYGRSMFLFRSRCNPLTIKAIRVLGLHSFECGWYVMEWHLIQ